MCRSGRTDYYAKFQVREDEVERCRTRDGREVYRVPNRDVKLDPWDRPRIRKTGEEDKKDDPDDSAGAVCLLLH